MFIQIHERRMNRRLEEQAVLNRSYEQTSMMEDLAADLHTTQDVPVHIVSPDDAQTSHPIPPVSSKKKLTPLLFCFFVLYTLKLVLQPYRYHYEVSNPTGKTIVVRDVASQIECQVII